MNPLVPTLTLRARGAATPEEAWERYADLRRWPEWSPQISRVEAPSTRLRVGLEGDVVGPLGFRVPFTITDVAIRQWAWQVRLPIGITLSMVHTVVAASSGCSTELSMTGPAPLVLGYVPLAQLALRRLVMA